MPVYSDLLLSDSLCMCVSADALQVRGVGVGCESPHLGSILRVLRMGLVPA